MPYKQGDGPTFHCYGLVQCQLSGGYLGNRGQNIKRIRFTSHAMIRLRHVRIKLGTFGKMRGIKIWGNLQEVTDAIMLSAGSIRNDQKRKGEDDAELSWSMLCPRRIHFPYWSISNELGIDIMREKSRGWDLIHIRGTEEKKDRMRQAVVKILTETPLGKFDLQYELQVLGPSICHEIKKDGGYKGKMHFGERCNHKQNKKNDSDSEAEPEREDFRSKFDLPDEQQPPTNEFRSKFDLPEPPTMETNAFRSKFDLPEPPVNFQNNNGGGVVSKPNLEEDFSYDPPPPPSKHFHHTPPIPQQQPQQQQYRANHDLHTSNPRHHQSDTQQFLLENSHQQQSREHSHHQDYPAQQHHHQVPAAPSRSVQERPKFHSYGEEPLHQDRRSHAPPPQHNRFEPLHRDHRSNPPPPQYNRFESLHRDHRSHAPPPQHNRFEPLHRDHRSNPPPPQHNRFEPLHRDHRSNPPPPQHNRFEPLHRDHRSNPPPPQHNRFEPLHRDHRSNPPPPQHNRFEPLHRDHRSHAPPPQHNRSEPLHRDHRSHAPPPQHSRAEPLHRDHCSHPPLPQHSRFNPYPNPRDQNQVRQLHHSPRRNELPRISEFETDRNENNNLKPPAYDYDYEQKKLRNNEDRHYVNDPNRLLPHDYNQLPPQQAQSSSIENHMNLSIPAFDKPMSHNFNPYPQQQQQQFEIKNEKVRTINENDNDNFDFSILGVKEEPKKQKGEYRQQQEEYSRNFGLQQQKVQVQVKNKNIDIDLNVQQASLNMKLNSTYIQDKEVPISTGYSPQVETRKRRRSSSSRQREKSRSVYRQMQQQIEPKTEQLGVDGLFKLINFYETENENNKKKERGTEILIEQKKWKKRLAARPKKMKKWAPLLEGFPGAEIDENEIGKGPKLRRRR